MRDVAQPIPGSAVARSHSPASALRSQTGLHTNLRAYAVGTDKDQKLHARLSGRVHRPAGPLVQPQLLKAGRAHCCLVASKGLRLPLRLAGGPAVQRGSGSHPLNPHALMACSLASLSWVDCSSDWPTAPSCIAGVRGSQGAWPNPLLSQTHQILTLLCGDCNRSMLVTVPFKDWLHSPSLDDFMGRSVRAGPQDSASWPCQHSVCSWKCVQPLQSCQASKKSASKISCFLFLGALQCYLY